MIPRVNSLLCSWAKWAVSAITRDVGYPSVSPMFRDASRSGVYRSSEPVGCASRIDMEAVDQSVRALPLVQRLCVLEYYQRGGKDSADEVASRLGLRKSQMYRYLDAAHEAIDADVATMA